MDYVDALERFIDNMEFVRNFSENTLKAYERDLLCFKKYVDTHDLDYQGVKRRDIERFIKELAQGKYTSSKPAASTVSRNLAAVSSFYKFLYISGAAGEIPTQFIKPPKG